MAISYKRTLIQVPLKDVKVFEGYAKKYGMSFSGAIVFLAKKSLEQEKVMEKLPDMITIIQEEQRQRLNSSKTDKKALKK